MLRNSIELDDSSYYSLCLAICGKFKCVWENFDNQRNLELKNLLPIAENIFVFSKNKGDLNISYGLGRDIAKYQHINGQIKKSLGLLNNIFTEICYEKHIDPIYKATFIGDLSLLFQEVGELKAACNALRISIQIFEEYYDSDHESIVTKKNNLSMILKDLGNFEEAYKLMKEVLAEDSKKYDLYHPNVISSKQNLALILQNLGRLKEAENILQDTLISYQKVYPKDHLNIAINQSNLAMVLKDQNLNNAALKLFENSLFSLLKNFDKNHYYINRAKYNLASVHDNLGNLEIAKTLLEEAIISDEKNFAEDHPSLVAKKKYLNDLIYKINLSK